ncbi:ArsC family reductase [Sphingomonas sp. BT-65]|uniref:ArsC family reductase n=1 Tax=Sphingomonas sp. BT-65 TaxID=2989821 RepID=UPI002235FC06|nr:ArsC family reductase [Sphingomonas sp. BT-65]MCW4460658.1 ArsC family reductase [Sphingomonas sp. BT-65]
MSVSFYGIPNCDTVKKARTWLDANGVAYDFHDYKKEGVDPARLAKWAEAVGWERLLNRAGATFRKLDEADKADIDKAKALELMAAHPSVIKRPVVEYRGGVLVGFKAEEWATALL